MLISDLISILENFKSDNNDIDVNILLDDTVYDLNLESIYITEKETGDKVLAIDVDHFVYDDVDDDE